MEFHNLAQKPIAKKIIEKKDSSFAIAIIDLDYFKDINDNMGHDVGDHYLVKISNEIIEEAYDETQDVFDLLDTAEAKLYEVTQGKTHE